jgi:glutamate-ammonia-ligase adenylyltransferase
MPEETSTVPSTRPPLDAAALAAQLATAELALTAAEQERALALLASAAAGRFATDVAPSADGGWRLLVCAPDRPGALSLIAGLLTATRLDITRADVLTVREPAVPAPARRRPRQSREAPRRRAWLLDRFELRPLDALAPDTWARLDGALAEVSTRLDAGDDAGARDLVIERVAAALPALAPAARALLPVAVEIEPTAEGATLLHVRGADTAGFLFELTNALALLGVNIERAEVRSVAGESRDRFWVVDAQGRPIGDEARLHELRVAVALIKQFTLLLPAAPNPGLALRQFSAFVRQLLARPEWTRELADVETGATLGALAALMGVSEFLWEDFLRIQHENLFPVLADRVGLAEGRSREQLAELLRARVAAAGDAATRADALNAFKDREMFRIDLRHINGAVDFQGFAGELTALGEAVIAGAAELAFAGLPPSAPGPGGWVICALGKFGGRELGFASDVELLVAYDAAGAQPDADRYYEAFVQALLRTVRPRREGIFEIDLRLRPYGDGGPLASSLAGLAAYYAPGGDARQFERLALVKLRPVAGDAALGARVQAVRDAFVYSGAPLDFAELRHLRERQARELVPAGAVSAKHSDGGVVDIEYAVQARQIIAGAHDASVRVTGTREAIERLRAGGYVAAERAAALTAAYAFLRRLIDALRVVRGHARDLTLPAPGSDAYRYLGRRLGLEPAELAASIAAQMAVARAAWDGVEQFAEAARQR